MEEKTDKVVGYIEYLGAGGIIGEIVPYTSVEKFKDEILDSLDCGRPVTPVVFSDELDEPLQFDSDTYFPWGFRSEKRVQIPYEIYQTNRRDLVFMEYSPARLAAGAKDYELVYKGQMERCHRHPHFQQYDRAVYHAALFAAVHLGTQRPCKL